MDILACFLPIQNNVHTFIQNPCAALKLGFYLTLGPGCGPMPPDTHSGCAVFCPIMRPPPHILSTNTHAWDAPDLLTHPSHLCLGPGSGMSLGGPSPREKGKLRTRQFLPACLPDTGCVPDSQGETVQSQCWWEEPYSGQKLPGCLIPTADPKPRLPAEF